MTIAQDGAAIARNDASLEDWLVGGGEMAKVIKAMDWSKTPLGPMASWPQSLRTTVSLVQASNSPISLLGARATSKSTTTAIGPSAAPNIQRRWAKTFANAGPPRSR